MTHSGALARVLLFSQQHSFSISTWCTIGACAVLAYMALLLTQYIGLAGPPDMYRDFLVARNIAVHGQWIAVGPWNGVFDALASPAYNYLLALPLFVAGAQLPVLMLANVILQLCGMAAVYMFGRTAFSPTVGLIALLLYAFHRSVLQQGMWVFQPFVMVPILYIAYYVLSAAYVKSRYSLLLCAGVIAALAGVVHNSALTVLPVVCVAAGLLCWHRKWGIARYLIFVEVLALTLLVAYIPPVLYLHAHGMPIAAAVARGFEFSLAAYMTNLAQVIQTVSQFNSSLLYGSQHGFLFGTWWQNILGFFAFAGAVVYMVLPRVPKERKIILLLLGGCIMLALLVGAAIHQDVYARRFLLILGPAAVIVAEVLATVLSKFIWTRLVCVAMVAVVVIAYMYQPSTFVLGENRRQDKDFIVDPRLSEAIVNDVVTLRSREHRNTHTFFQLYLYPNTPWINTWSNAQYWLGVEQVFLKRGLGAHTFLVNDDSAIGLGYRQASDNAYAFVICVRYIIDPLTTKDCLGKYIESNRNFDLVKTTYEDNTYTVFLTKKRN